MFYECIYMLSYIVYIKHIIHKNANKSEGLYSRVVSMQTSFCRKLQKSSLIMATHMNNRLHVVYETCSFQYLCRPLAARSSINSHLKTAIADMVKPGTNTYCPIILCGTKQEPVYL